MLSNIPEDILVNDMNLMLALINNNIECILYAPNKLKNNPVFIQKVMGIDASLLEYATDELRSNPKFIQEMMGINASLLEDSMNDIEEKRESNKTDLKLLKYATKELAIKLVMHDGDYLKYLSDELRANYDIVLAAVKNNGISIKHAPKILRQQTNIASEAIKQNGHAVKYIPPELLTYETLVLEAIKTNRDALKYSESLQSDKKFLLKALAMSPNIILNIDRELLNDRDFMLKAFKINANIVKIKPQCIDIIFSDETFKNYFNCLGDEKTIDLLAGRADLISLHDKKDNKDFILQVLDQTVWILQYVQNEILTDPEIIAKAPSFATEILLSKKLINNESPQSVMDQEIVGFSQVAPRKAFRPTPKTTINSRLVKDILQGNRADNQGREIYRG